MTPTNPACPRNLSQSVCADNSDINCHPDLDMNSRLSGLCQQLFRHSAHCGNGQKSSSVWHVCLTKVVLLTLMFVLIHRHNVLEQPLHDSEVSNTAKSISSLYLKPFEKGQEYITNIYYYKYVCCLIGYSGYLWHWLATGRASGIKNAAKIIPHRIYFICSGAPMFTFFSVPHY